MGLFNWFKSKPKVAEESAQAVVAEKATETQASNQQKKSFKDFIDYDFSSIKEDAYSERIILDTPIFGSFYYIEVCRFDNGTASNVELISHSKKFTPELREFIAFCADEFGPTKAGETSVTPTDEKLLMLGRFSRMWPNLWLECGPDMENGGITALRITLYDVQNKLSK